MRDQVERRNTVKNAKKGRRTKRKKEREGEKGMKTGMRKEGSKVFGASFVISRQLP
jgi:hypothetical protein